jgi:hypothetical protein
MHDLSAEPASAHLRQEVMTRLAHMQRELGDPLVLRT